MYQIMKVVGVTPEALANLHKVLESDAVKADKEVALLTKSDNILREKVVCAELLSSKLEEGRQTYRVEIKVFMKFPCLEPNLSGEWKDQGRKVPAVLFPSIEIVRAIYSAFGVYPEKERIIVSKEQEDGKPL